MELKINNLKKMYGKKEALKEASFSLTTGIYGLLGPNGAGKSTLIGLLTGNIKADSGSVLYNGKEIECLGDEYRKNLGYMPQQQALYPSFTAEGFLDYMAALKGMDKQIVKRRIQEVLGLVDLDAYARHKIKTFSGGMKQRLLLAQAILDDPKIIILDEPTAGLDPKQRISVRNLITQIASDKIIIFATHVVSDIELIANELILLSDGELIEKGNKKEILSKLNGCVYEVKLSMSQYENVKHEWCIGGVSQIDNKVYARVISDDPNFFDNAVEVRPSLEDVYLYYFGGI